MSTDASVCPLRIWCSSWVFSAEVYVVLLVCLKCLLHHLNTFKKACFLNQNFLTNGVKAGFFRGMKFMCCVPQWIQIEEGWKTYSGSGIKDSWLSADSGEVGTFCQAAKKICKSPEKMKSSVFLFFIYRLPFFFFSLHVYWVSFH